MALDRQAKVHGRGQAVRLRHRRLRGGSRPQYPGVLSGHFVEWQPPSATVEARGPRSLPPAPAAAAKPRPEIVVIDGDDAVESWKATLEQHTAKLDGDAGLARILLLGDTKASELYLRAARVWTETERRKHGAVSFRAPMSAEL